MGLSVAKERSGEIGQKTLPSCQSFGHRLARLFCAREKTVDLLHGTKDVLAYVLGPRYWSGFRSAAMVGTGRNHPDLHPELVGGLSQRLVLTFWPLRARPSPRRLIALTA